MHIAFNTHTIIGLVTLATIVALSALVFFWRRRLSHYRCRALDHVDNSAINSQLDAAKGVDLVSFVDSSNGYLGSLMLEGTRFALICTVGLYVFSLLFSVVGREANLLLILPVATLMVLVRHTVESARTLHSWEQVAAQLTVQLK